MSTTRGIRTLAGVALASSVILLGGCSSSGTASGSPLAGGLGSHSSAAGSTGGTSSTGGSSTGGSSSSGDSSSSNDSSTSGGTTGAIGGSAANDPGCEAAIAAISSVAGNANPSDPTAQKNAATQLAGKMHDAAGQSKNPAAAAALNKLGDDYAAAASALAAGKTPNSAALKTDATAVTTLCIGVGG